MLWDNKTPLRLAACLCAIMAELSLAHAHAAERPIKIAAFGALTGPVKSFGINSRAALEAAVDRINRDGGVTLSDGATGRFEISYRFSTGSPENFCWIAALSAGIRVRKSAESM